MSSLIREGSPGPAILRVTLLNEGSDAFQAEYYGNRIIIERKIPKTGASTYKLLNANGTVVSTKKEDLEKILRIFNLHADNPCCILTQEESKKFIQGHEKEKYQFFMKASGLDITFDEIEKIRAQIELARKSISGYDEKLQSKKDAILKVKAELKKLMELDSFEEEIQLCQAKMFWREVVELEAVLEKTMETFKLREEESEALKLQVEQSQAELNAMQDLGGISSKLEQIQSGLEAMAGEVEARAGEVALCRKRHSALDTNRKEMIKERGLLISRLDGLKKQVTGLNKGPAFSPG